MKKIILWVLLAAVVIGAVIGVAVSVNNTTDPQQTEAPTNATEEIPETTGTDTDVENKDGFPMWIAIIAAGAVIVVIAVVIVIKKKH